MSATRSRRVRRPPDRSRWPVYVSNERVADVLDDVAALLEPAEPNPYRVQAWRTGAATVRALDGGVAEILDREGTAGLDRLPGIGPVLARAIAEIVQTGRLRMLDRLRGRR